MWLAGGQLNGTEWEPVGPKVPTVPPSTARVTDWAFWVDQVTAMVVPGEQGGLDWLAWNRRTWGAAGAVVLVVLVLVVELLVVVLELEVVLAAAWDEPPFPPPTTRAMRAPTRTPARAIPPRSRPRRESEGSSPLPSHPPLPQQPVYQAAIPDRCEVPAARWRGRLPTLRLFCH